MTKEQTRTLDLLEARLRAVFKPEEADDIIEWLEKNVHAIPYSPMPGPFRASSSPWIVEPLRATVDPELKLVAILAPIQSGKSLILELLSCYLISKMPGPTLYLQDTDPNAKDWFQSRLRELWDHCPPTQSRHKPDESSALAQVFQRMRLYTLGAHNERNLQRRTIRWCVGDEVWQWPAGHIQQARNRIKAFGWLGKCVFASQGGVEGDEWSELFNSTDRREWTFQCPCCGTRQPFVWEQVQYPEGYKRPDGYDYKLLEKGTTYKCVNCDKTWADSDGSRHEMNATGMYVAQNGNAETGSAGFHWNSLCCRSWGELAVAVIRAKEAAHAFSDDEPRKLFKQQQMALPWSDAPDDYDLSGSASEYKMGDDWEDEAVMYDRHIYPGTPENRELLKKGGCRVRFMGVDVQKNGFYYAIRSYSSDGRSRLIRWGFLNTFEEVLRTQVKNEVHPSMVGVDSGFMTDDVYRFCAEHGYTATKGSAQSEFPWKVTKFGKTYVEYRPYKPPQIINVGRKCRLILYSNLMVKDTLARLRKGGVLSYPMDAGEEYEKQMTSEVRVKTPSGRPEWQLLNNRANHVFDCEAICLVPALILRLAGRRAQQRRQEELDQAQPADTSGG